MVTHKTVTLTFRIDPEVKERLKELADEENRSVGNYVLTYLYGEMVNRIAELDKKPRPRGVKMGRPRKDQHN